MDIREIKGRDELRAVEALQKEVWGVSDLEIVPAIELIATQHVGAILIGAFDGSDLVAFVYGFPGFEGERRIIHSDMLAVRTTYRDRGLGRTLKLAQRDAALVRGVEHITWTFDPLQTRNAFLNFEKLGVTSDRYFRDFYGETTSPLHEGGTDRLWVTWHLRERPAFEPSTERIAVTTREETRHAFERAFASGLIAVGFDRQRLEYELAVPASHP
ncbi:MAG TPA: GNAT family N-acetyltransferase [Thermoanaerobaculia bacterium]|jgi:predicted GNAT superfamily acetyltransferase|nr:GNAT family N-acetyltransferase [Thermoanaerobaculia bacterium]